MLKSFRVLGVGRGEVFCKEELVALSFESLCFSLKGVRRAGVSRPGHDVGGEIEGDERTLTFISREDHAVPELCLHFHRKREMRVNEYVTATLPSQPRYTRCRGF